jgi:hypothetical protein
VHDPTETGARARPGSQAYGIKGVSHQKLYLTANVGISLPVVGDCVNLKSVSMVPNWSIERLYRRALHAASNADNRWLPIVKINTVEALLNSRLAESLCFR